MKAIATIDNEDIGGIERDLEREHVPRSRTARRAQRDLTGRNAFGVAVLERANASLDDATEEDGR